jgi:hypothetical protein
MSNDTQKPATPNTQQPGQPQQNQGDRKPANDKPGSQQK